MILGSRRSAAALTALLLFAGAGPAVAARDSTPVRKFNPNPVALLVGTTWQGSAQIGRKRGRLALLQRSKSEYGKFSTVRRLRTGPGGKITFSVPMPERGRWFWRISVPITKRYYAELSFTKQIDVTDAFPKRISGRYNTVNEALGSYSLTATGDVSFVIDKQETDADTVSYVAESVTVDWKVVGLGGWCDYTGAGFLAQPVLAHARLLVERTPVAGGWPWRVRIGLEGPPAGPALNVTRVCNTTETFDFSEPLGYVQDAGLVNLGDETEKGGDRQATADLGVFTATGGYPAGDDRGFAWEVQLSGSDLAPR